MDPIGIDGSVIKSVSLKVGHKYLGVRFSPTDNMTSIITKNLHERTCNIAKFMAWLQINENTPIEIKLTVLDSCLFNAILYGVEAWGDISCMKDDLRSIEVKILKAIMKAKKGTSNDLVFNDLKRPNIISQIKDGQCNFLPPFREFK